MHSIKVGSSPHYPVNMNPHFDTYGQKFWEIKDALPLIKNILGSEDFQTNPRLYFEKWKIENPHRFHLGDKYVSCPTVPLIVKSITSYLRGEKDILIKLKEKRKFYKKIDNLLQEIKLELENKPPKEESKILIRHINNYTEKSHKELPEILVLRTIRKIFEGMINYSIYEENELSHQKIE